MYIMRFLQMRIIIKSKWIKYLQSMIGRRVNMPSRGILCGLQSNAFWYHLDTGDDAEDKIDNVQTTITLPNSSSRFLKAILHLIRVEVEKEALHGRNAKLEGFPHQNSELWVSAIALSDTPVAASLYQTLKVRN